MTVAPRRSRRRITAIHLRRQGWHLQWRRRGPRERDEKSPPAATPAQPREQSARRAPATPALSYPARRRPVVLFACGLGLCVVLLVLLAYVVGHGSDVGLGEFVNSVLSASTGNVTGTVVAFALLIAAAWCVRRLWLEWLAWRPGQVVIPVFTEGSELTDANPLHLTALFRQRFAAVRLQSPAPVPGAAPEADFLEVLGQKSPDSGKPLASLVALAQAAKPTHAYVVHGVLVERSEHPSYGVTIQVVRMPEEGAPPETVYDISWERAVRRAADRAMAHILPRTRRCDAPWASWRGYVMPTLLLETYEAAVSFEEQRRYDQALAYYFDALERDPMNLSLRLHIGHLQEKLGLYIDALATYEGMLAVAEEPDGSSRVKLYRPIAERERSRVLLLARYRRVVLVGGPPLAEQWRQTSSPEQRTERDDQRADIRNRLRRRLVERLQPAAREDESVEGLLAEPERPYDSEVEKDPLLNPLRGVLVRHALAELEGLERDLGNFRGHSGDAPIALTNTSLKLTRVCLSERRRWIEQQMTEPRRWIWDAEDVTRITAAVYGAADGRGMLRWHEHYNAACAFALPLLVRDESQPAIRDQLAECAVRHLQQATSCADSGYIATRRDWLLSEDPDFDGLRVHTSFKAFEAMYFPAAVPTPRRPRHVQRLEVSRYTRDLVDATARRWQAEWHRRRAANNHEDPHALIQWWQDEAEAWALVGHVAWNHRRWRVRCDLLERMDDLSVRYGSAPLEVAFRAFEEPWMSQPSEREVDDLARAALNGATEQLRDLARALCPSDPIEGKFEVDGIEDWINTLRDHDADGRSANADDVLRLCDRHAAVWERLHLWVTERNEPAVYRAADHFTAQLAKLSHQLHSVA